MLSSDVLSSDVLSSDVLSAFAWVCAAVAIHLAPGRAGDRGRLAALTGAGRLPERARSAASSSRRWDVSWLLVAAPAVAMWVSTGPAWALGTASLAGAVRLLLRDGLRRRRADAEQRDLLLAVRMLVTELEAGASPERALASVADVLPVHGALLRAAAAGDGPGADVLIDCGVPALSAVGHAIRVAQDSGAPSADVMRAVAGDLAAEAAQRHAVDVAVAGPRASATMLAGLPIVGVGLGLAMGADPLHVLFGSTAGHLLGCVGAMLDALGIAWTYRLIASAERAP